MPTCEAAGSSPDSSRPGYLNSHLLFRMTRQLTENGKPLPPGVLLGVRNRASQEDVLAGGLALTERGMLSYWPPTVARLMRSHPSEECVIDHATLAVQGGRSHLTCYDADNARCRPNELTSKLVPFPKDGSGYHVWLFAALPWKVMRDQVGFFKEWMPTPCSDEERRKREVVHFTNSLDTWQISLPGPPADGDFLVLELGLADNPKNVPIVPPSFGELEAEVQGWETPSHVGVTACKFAGVYIGLRTFLPAGGLNEHVLLGRPQAKSAGA